MNEEEIISNLKQIVTIRKIIFAKTFLQQTLGLMFKKSLPEGYGMWFELKKPKNVLVHSWFMKFSINIFFLNEKYELIKIIKNMKPWKIIRVKEVKAFLEMETKGGNIK